jgi:hypothetical protein
VRLARSCLLLFALCLIAPASAFALAEPTLTLSATGAEFNGPVHATGTLAAGTAPTGFISFSAYAPDDPTCVGSPVFTDSSVPVTDNGDYSSGDFAPTGAGTFHWSASYSGDGENAPAEANCTASSVVTKANTGISTTATSATVGSAISDSATISGGVSPGGQITFKAFGPADATCALSPAFEVDVPVNGSGNYGSGNFVPTVAGSYNWTASYSGDEDNPGALSGCGAANETSTVSKASPGLITTATSATVGSTISDSANLSAGFTPTGTITFKAFGPNDTTCALSPAFEVSVPVSGNATYPSGPFSPTAVGSYRWTAAYSGDANNNVASSGCNAANETSTVSKASPGLLTTATSATVGSAISDSGNLSAGFNPTGSITFKAFGPNDATCALAPAFEVSVAVNSGNSTYASGDFNGAVLGAYRWTAAYSGDANNNTASSGCNAANETSTVGDANPTLTTSAAGAEVGTPISDVATIAGGFNPTGQITFKAFGPGDSTCSNPPLFTSNVAVAGNSTYSSGGFTPAQLGTYRWTVTYPGDADNNPAPSSVCAAAAGKTSVVSKAAPALPSAASGSSIGSSIADIATFSGGFQHTGQIVFRAYGPEDGACAGAPAFATTVDVTPGNGTYASGAFTPTRVGSYRWTTTYSGDALNNAATSACNAPSSTSTVIPAAPTIAAKVSAATAPIGTKEHDSATLSGAYQPSGTITFRLFGPGDTNCSSPPVFADTAPATANGTFSSAAIAPATPGQYRFVASYSGDAANGPVASACASTTQVLTVDKRTPRLSARASLRGTRKIAARATLAGAAAPKGKITFQIFGPNNSRCAGKPVFSQRISVHGGGSYQPAVFRARAAGVYRLTVAYAGDAWNKPARSSCNAAGQSIRVGSK